MGMPFHVFSDDWYKTMPEDNFYYLKDLEDDLFHIVNLKRLLYTKQ